MSIPTGYLKRDEVEFLLEAWRDDFAYRAGCSIDLSKKGAVSEIAENSEKMFKCAMIYLALKELSKEYEGATEIPKNDDTFGSGMPDGVSEP